MFLGQEKRIIDKKGRLSIPAKYRDYLIEDIEKTSKKMVLTCGDNSSLILYPPTNWETTVERIKVLPSMRKDTKSYRRQIFSNAAEVDFDSAGRILLPLFHREYAQLDENVIVIGQYDSIEIWAPDIWEEYINRPENKIDLLEDKLGDYLYRNDKG